MNTSSWTQRFFHAATTLTLPLLMLGCRSTQPVSDPSSPEAPVVEQKIEGQKVLLATFSDRLLFKAAQHRPLIGKNYIVDYRHSDLTIYDSATLALLKVFPKMSCDQAPTFLDDHTMILAHDQNLVSIDLATMEVSTLAHLDAPLMTAPFVMENNLIFLQYMNNIAQCFDMNGHSLWKTMLPYGASYYKQTSYRPCADKGSVYLAYPGGPLLKLQQKTGIIEWGSSIISDQGQSNAAFSLKQLNAPLTQSDSLLFARTSEDQCLCIDKSTGRLLKTIALAPKSQSYMNETFLYAMTSPTTLSCYSLETLQVQWSQELEGTNSVIVGEINGHPSTLFVCDPQGKLLALDNKSGIILDSCDHKLQNFDVFSRDENIYAFNAHGTLVKLNIPSSMTS